MDSRASPWYRCNFDRHSTALSRCCKGVMRRESYPETIRSTGGSRPYSPSAGVAQGTPETNKRLSIALFPSITIQLVNRIRGRESLFSRNFAPTRLRSRAELVLLTVAKRTRYDVGT